MPIKNNNLTSELLQKLEAQKKDLQDLSAKESSSLILQDVPQHQYNPAEDGGLWLTGMILGFSLIVIGIMSHLIKNGSDSESLLKVFGTVLIIVASVFLIVAGYSEKQIAPVIGLLGTIAGYLLGKHHAERKP